MIGATVRIPIIRIEKIVGRIAILDGDSNATLSHDAYFVAIPIEKLTIYVITGMI